MDLEGPLAADGSGVLEPYVQRIAYNAKGQRALIVYGNGLITRYAYDAQTFRLARLRTDRLGANPAPLGYQPKGAPLQDMAYRYDLVGNILSILDRTPGCGVSNNPEVVFQRGPLRELLSQGNALLRCFEYDPLYRLMSATGRESKDISSPRSLNDDASKRRGFDPRPDGTPGTPDQENARDLTSMYWEEYSSGLVVSDKGHWINREEFFPNGETSFGGFRRKRYRYTGKERDEESGLCYYGARHYAVWLCRWMSCDPLRTIDGPNTYLYTSANPVRFVDSTGNATEELREVTFAPILANSGASAAQWYADLVVEGENQGGIVGGAKVAGGWVGGVFASLWTPETATSTGVTLATAGVGSLATAGALGVASSPIATTLGVAGSYESGVSGVQALTGTSTGAHIPSLLTAANGGDLDVGRKLAPVERGLEGLNAVTGALKLSKGYALQQAAAVPKQQAPSAHGNSLNGTKPQHVYQIDDASTPGVPYKFGVSGQKLNANGSPRANSQVNKSNTKNPAGPGEPPRFTAKLVGQDLPNRRAALAFEQHLVNVQKNTLGQAGPGNAKPLPNDMLGPGAR